MVIKLAIMVYNSKDIRTAYEIAGKGEPVIGKIYTGENELEYLRVNLSEDFEYQFRYLMKEYELTGENIILSLDEFSTLKFNLDLGLIPFDYDIIRERGM